MYSQTLVPIFVCCVLPIAVVLISAIQKINRDRERSRILMKAIEANNDIDIEKLAEMQRRPPRSQQEIRNRRLLFGCIFSLLGLFIAAVGIFNLACGTPSEADPVTVPLLFGGASIAVGASFLIVWYVTRNQKSDDGAKRN